MYLIDSDGATNDNKFTDGDSVLGTPATVLPAEYLNMLQDELQAVIVAAGIELDKGANDQLLAALTALGLRSATTTLRGVVELATSTETIAGTDAVRAVTPAGLAGLTAQFARRGLVELATSTETIAGDDNTIAVTPEGLAALTASDVRRGLVELATSAEVIAGADAARAVTPAALAALTALTSRRGLVELATSTETIAGADSSRVVTPAGLDAVFPRSVGNSGYIQLPGGLIFQWLYVSSTTTANQSFSFPTTFPNACFGAIANMRVSGVTSNVGWAVASWTQSTVTLEKDDDMAGTHYATVFAIGH